MAFSEDVLQAIDRASVAAGIESAALRAVVEVESGGRATSHVDGREMPLILYEYHVFNRWPGLTAAQRAEAVKRKLCASKWGAIPYPKTQTARYAQLWKAAAINEQAAYAACSWGVGQVLGENAEWLGYSSPKALAEKAMEGVEGQVEVMLAFVRKRGLLDNLAVHDWRGFARAYNGAGQVDYYAGRMAAAYRRHAGRDASPPSSQSLRIGAKGDAVAELQRRLRGLGYHLIVDGDFGPATLRMVKQFQAEHDLTPDGIVGPSTLGRIEVLLGQPADPA